MDKSEDKEEIQWKLHFISYLAPTPTTAINMSEMSFSSGRPELIVSARVLR